MARYFCLRRNNIYVSLCWRETSYSCRKSCFSSSTITSPRAFVFVVLAPAFCRSNRFRFPVSFFLGGAAPIPWHKCAWGTTAYTLFMYVSELLLFWITLVLDFVVICTHLYVIVRCSSGYGNSHVQEPQMQTQGLGATQVSGITDCT